MTGDRWPSLVGPLLFFILLGAVAMDEPPALLASSVAATKTPVATATPSLSGEAAKLVLDFNQSPYGAMTRWNSPMRIWTDASFSRGDVQEAIALWETVIGTGQQFVIADDSAAANVHFRIGAVPQGFCGYEGPSLIQNHVIMAGEGVYSSAPECTGQGIPARTAIAHGIGHILGIAGHTPSATDIMSSSLSLFLVSPTLADAMRYIYPPAADAASAPAGTATPPPTATPTRTSTRAPTQTPTATVTSIAAPTSVSADVDP